MSLPGSRLSSASTSRLFEPSKISVLTSPKFSAGADAAVGCSGTGTAVDDPRPAFVDVPEPVATAGAPRDGVAGAGVDDDDGAGFAAADVAAGCDPVGALVAALLGFTGLAGTAAGLAKILFAVFLVLFLVSLVFGRRRVP